MKFQFTQNDLKFLKNSFTSDHLEDLDGNEILPNDENQELFSSVNEIYDIFQGSDNLGDLLKGIEDNEIDCEVEVRAEYSSGATNDNLLSVHFYFDDYDYFIRTVYGIREFEVID